MVLLVAVAVAAVLWRPVRFGGLLLAGAVIPLLAQAISAMVELGQATSPALFGYTSAQAQQLGLTISNGLTPVFWVFCVFVVALAVACAWMFVTPDGAPLGPSGHGRVYPHAYPPAWWSPNSPGSPSGPGNLAGQMGPVGQPGPAAQEGPAWQPGPVAQEGAAWQPAPAQEASAAQGSAASVPEAASVPAAASVPEAASSPVVSPQDEESAPRWDEESAPRSDEESAPGRDEGSAPLHGDGPENKAQED